MFSLVIDDGVEGRGHRTNLFLEDITHVSCGTASHPIGVVAVFDLCQKTGDAKPGRSGGRAAPKKVAKKPAGKAVTKTTTKVPVKAGTTTKKIIKSKRPEGMPEGCVSMSTKTSKKISGGKTTETVTKEYKMADGSTRTETITKTY